MWQREENILNIESMPDVVQEVIYFQYIVSFIIWCLERIAKIRNVFMCNSSSSSVTFLIKATL